MRSNLEIEIELLRAQLNALEKRVNESPLMMRRPGSVRYEKLVANPEKTTKDLMNFLQEKWVPGLLAHQNADHDFWFNKDKSETTSKVKEKQPERHSPSKPIFTSSAGKWKKQLNPVEKAITNLLMNKHLKILGYK